MHATGSGDSELSIEVRYWVEARWSLLAAVFFAVTAAALFTFFLISGRYPVTISQDWVLHGEPNLHFLRQALAAGEFPWWNPYVGLGRPYASDIQSALYYPLTYVLLLGPAVGLPWFLGTHAFLIILGTHLFCRQLGVRGVFGLLAGVTWLASMAVGGRLLVGHTFYFAGLSYVPLLFWALVRVRVRMTAWRTGWLVLLLALQFMTGHPQVFWCSTLGLGLFLAGLLVRPWSRVFWRRWMGLSWRFMGALLLAGGIAAVTWLPFLDLIVEGNRQEPSLAFAGFGPFEWRYLYYFVAVATEFGESVYWEQNWWFGRAGWVAGLAGLCWIGNVGVRALVLVGAVAFWFSLGEASWLFRVSFELLPGASSFRVPARIGVLPLFTLACAGAVMFSRRLPSAALIGRSGLIWVAPVACLALVVYFVCPLAARATLPALSIGLAVAAGLLAVWRAQHRWPLAIRLTALTLWLALQGEELHRSYVYHAQLYSFERFHGYPPGLIEARSLTRVVVPDPAGVPQRVMVSNPPNRGMHEGWAHVDSYTALFLRRPWNFLHAAAEVAPPTGKNASLASACYGVKGGTFPNLSLNFYEDLETHRLVRHPTSLPRLWITFTPRQVDRSEAALTAVAKPLDLPREGIVESAWLHPPPDGPVQGSAVIQRFGHSEIQVDCRLSHPGLLVLNEAWYPGWHTYVGGQRVDSQPVNYWMRGFVLPAGEHQLTLRFRPRRQALAVVITLAALVGWIAIMWRFRPQF